MRVTINVSDVLAARAHEMGLSVEAYVEQLLVKHCAQRTLEPRTEKPSTVAEAIDQIREIGKGNKLEGENIKDWIHGKF